MDSPRQHIEPNPPRDLLRARLHWKTLKMELSPEDSPEMEGVEKNELTPEEIRRKRLALKVQKLKFEKGLGYKRSKSNSSLTMAAVYELRLKKLRKNNRGLAKALSEQKIATQQRYNEVISLQGELQEVNERLLKSNDRNFDAIVEQEVDHRFKELGDTLNQSISQAMENLLVVVESFSKVKQLANMRSSSISRISSSSSSSFSFPRPLASRTPLSSYGYNNSSPRQSVLPMVSGHVLQPAMVAVQKLDDIWKARVKERIQARQDLLDMSTIGETSTVVANDSSVSNADRNDTTTEESDAASDAENNVSSQSSDGISSDVLAAETTTLTRSPKSPGRSPQLRRSGRKTRSPKKFDESPRRENDTSASDSQGLTSKPDHKINESVNLPALEHIDDPLEGPSWWYADTASNRGRGRGRGRTRSRGNKRGRPKSSSRPRILCHADVSLEVSSESEEEESSKKKTRTTPHTSIVINDGGETPVLKSPRSPKPVLDRSYLSSPKTMLTKLEALEAKGGRRSKAKSKGRSLRVSGMVSEPERKSLRRISAESDSSLTLALSDSACENENHSPVVNREPEALEPPVVETINTRNDFLLRDADMTCIANESMDMTEPISRLLARAEESKESEKEPVRNARRFFKKNETGEVERVASPKKPPEKTPFDVSLMDATCVAIPPYSSQKCVEKENMPPESDCNDNINKESDPNVSLRKVSIILQDFMKSPFVESTETTMIEGELKTKSVEGTPVVVNPVSENGGRRNARSKKPVKLSIIDLGDESNDDDDSWSPEAGKKRRSQKPRKTSVSKRNSSVTEKNVSDTKTVKKRNKSDCDISLKPTKNKLRNRGRGGERHSVAVSPNFDEAQNVDFEDINLNDCFVKICRTPLKELPRSAPADEDISFLLANKPDFTLTEKLNSAPSSTSQELNSPPSSASEDNLGSTKDFLDSLGMLDTVQNPSDHVVPEQLPDVEIGETPSEVVVSEASNSNREQTVGEDTGQVPDTNSLSKIAENKEENDLPAVESEVEAPRKRRSALKVTSFKEPKLGTKMRRPSECDNTSGFAKPKPPRKSGRKVSTS